MILCLFPVIFSVFFFCFRPRKRCFAKLPTGGTFSPHPPPHHIFGGETVHFRRVLSSHYSNIVDQYRALESLLRGRKKIKFHFYCRRRRHRRPSSPSPGSNDGLAPSKEPAWGGHGSKLININDRLLSFLSRGFWL